MYELLMTEVELRRLTDTCVGTEERRKRPFESQAIHNNNSHDIPTAYIPTAYIPTAYIPTAYIPTEKRWVITVYETHEPFLHSSPNRIAQREVLWFVLE